MKSAVALALPGVVLAIALVYPCPSQAQEKAAGPATPVVPAAPLPTPLASTAPAPVAPRVPSVPPLSGASGIRLPELPDLPHLAVNGPPGEQSASASQAEKGGDAGRAAPTGSTQSILGAMKFGTELYIGFSNAKGYHRYSDGFWAGSGPITPSTTFMSWDGGKGYAGRVSLGLGDNFNGSHRLYDQPSEAWFQFPVGKLSVTAGKYWVPFALQEWEYENKYGVMGQWSQMKNGLTLSVNSNTHTHTMNSYFRATRSLGGENIVGLSLAGGRGFTFDSDHNLGAGLDATFGWNGLKLTSEHLRGFAPGSRKFVFTWTKLSYEKLGRFKPFLGWYDWRDDTKKLGSFRSLVPGASYQLNENLALEGAWAATSGKNVGWFQLHYSWQ